MSRRYVNDANIRSWLSSVVRDINLSNKQPNAIVVPVRGGLSIGVMLSHYFDCPVYPVHVSLRDSAEIVDYISLERGFRQAWKHGSVLVVDDINDTGKTFKTIMDTIANIPLKGETRTAVLLEKSSSDFEADFVGEYIYEDREHEWVVFPWENWWSA